MFETTGNSNHARQIQLPLGERVPAPFWRPIHYLGSKLRLADSIRNLLAELDPSCGTVCDLFAGSGTVSMALRNERNVIASDIQEYSRVLCSALLCPAHLDDRTIACLLESTEHRRLKREKGLQPLLDYEQRAIDRALTEPTFLCDLVEHGSLLSLDHTNGSLGVALGAVAPHVEKQADALMMTRYFGGIYFSYRQSLFIDCARAAIDELPQSLRETCLSALLSTTSSIVNTVGKQFAQPMRPRRKDGTIKQHLISQMCRDRCEDPRRVFLGWLTKYSELSRTGNHQVIRGDYRDVLRRLHNVRVIYADPPYTRDHYSRFYHVLETLCLDDSPDVSTTLLTGSGEISRGFYRKDRHQSPFCIKSQAPRAFAELFAGSKALGVPLLVSYSPFVKNGHPRLLTVEAVAELASQYYSHVEVLTAGCIAHSKLNRSDLHLDATANAEVFMVCRT